MLATMPTSLKQDDDAAVLFVRGMPRELLNKLKGAAALQGKTLAEYVQQMCQVHIEELEKKGILPKSK
jgi:hypothetical protein